MARIQYQGLAEPLKQTEVVAETITVDKWQGASNIPQSNWKTSIRNSAFMAVMPTLFFTNVITAEVTSADKWHPKANEPVRTVEHREYEFPSSFIDTAQLTLGERITMDKWYQEPFLAPKDKVHIEYTFPSEFKWVYPLGTPVEEISTAVHQTQQLPPKSKEHREYVYPSVFKWDYPIGTPASIVGTAVHQTAQLYPRGSKHVEYQYPSTFWYPKVIINTSVVSGQMVNVVYPKTLQYQKLAYVPEPTVLIPAETISVDKWFVRANQPRQDVKRNQHLYPPFVIDPYQITQSEVSTVDRWIGYHPDFVWGKKHQEFTFPSNFIDTNLLTQSENITLDKWFKELDRQAIRLKVTPHLYPSTFWYPKIIISPTVVSGANVHVIYPQLRQYQSVTRDIKIPPETITMEKWLGERPVYIWDRKRQQYTYPFLFLFDKLDVNIWTKFDEDSATWTKTDKATASFSLVAKPTATFTKIDEPTATWTKTDESTATFTKGTKPPTMYSIPEDT